MNTISTSWHDSQFYAPLDHIEQEESRIDTLLAEFYHRNPITRIWRLREALPSYAFSLADIIEMIAYFGTEHTIETLENAYIEKYA